jgi:hypothetical protein
MNLPLCQIFSVLCKLIPFLRTADTTFVSPNYSTRFFASMKCGRAAGAYAASNLASHVPADDAAEFLTFSPGADDAYIIFPLPVYSR